MSSLNRIEEDLVYALKAGDKVGRETLRMLKAALKNKEIAKMAPLPEEEVIEVLRQEVKLRGEAADQYRKAGRTEAAEKEEKEKKIIEAYLPALLTQEELQKIVDEVIGETKARSPDQMGLVIRQVMNKVRGRAEGSRVAELVRKSLS